MNKENKLLLDLQYKTQLLLPADLAVKVMQYGELIDSGPYDDHKRRTSIELCSDDIQARVMTDDEYKAAYTRMKLRGDKDADS